MNKTIISGRLGKDPELRKTPNGHSVISTQIAVNQYTKNENEEPNVAWIDIVIWNKQADYIHENGEKGDTLVVEGRLDKRSWDDNNGVKRYVTEVIAERVELYKKSAAKKTYDYGSNMATSSVNRKDINTTDLPGTEELPF